MIAIAIPLAGMEFASFGLTRIHPDLFDQRELILVQLRPADFELIKETTASDLLGWDNPASTTARKKNCAGEEITYTFGRDRIRRHGKGAPNDAVVLVSGDSYTLGNEVNDDETYPAALEKLLGVPTANLGVSGYGPDQALLKLESQIGQFPRAKAVILSILYDDTARMLNSFRPLVQSPTERHFGLKPFIDDGSFRKIIGDNPYRSFDAFSAAALSAFDNDYWRRTRATFPYSASVVKMMTLPSFWVPLLTQITESFGRPHYDLLHRIPSVRRSLRALFERFAKWSSERGVTGIVVFIPVDARDQTSGLTAIAAATDAQRHALTFHNVEIADGSAYKHAAGCHPSVEGYRMIAASVGKVLEGLVKP